METDIQKVAAAAQMYGYCQAAVTQNEEDGKTGIFARVAINHRDSYKQWLMEMGVDVDKLPMDEVKAKAGRVARAKKAANARWARKGQ